MNYCLNFSRLQRLYKKIIFIVYVGGISLAQAQSVSENIEWTSQARIHIRCSVADLSFVETTSKNISIQSQLMNSGKPQGQGWNYKVEKNGSLISILCEPPMSALDKNSSLKYSIQIKGPSTPITAAVRFGGMDVLNLKELLSLTVENGYIKTKNTGQFLKLHILNGTLDVENHSGRLRVDAYDVKTKIQNVEGNVDINHFSGNLSLKAVQGEVNLESKKTIIAASALSSGLRFNIEAGRLDLEGMSGSVEGESDQASVQAQLQNPVRFKLKAKTASVKISVPSTSGAQVYFSLADGQFLVPSFLSQDNSGQVKLVKGSLRGSESGRLSVTGESGRVQLATY